MRRFAWVFALCAMMLAGFAQPSHAATPEEAKTYISGIGDRVLEVMNDASTNSSQKLDRLQGLFVNVVDVDWVGRFVLGRHWRTATDDQKAAYLAAYKDFLIKHYTSRFAEYSGETFTIENVEKRREGEFMVRMNIQRPRGQEPVIVDYMLREEKNGFKVFDIIVEGVSLISTQRSEFDSAVGRNGLDSLIATLKKKTAQLESKTKQEITAKDKAAEAAQ